MQPGVVDQVAAHPFFKGMTHEHMLRVAQCARIEVYEYARYIFREGEESKHFYAVIDGVISVEIRAPSEGAVPIQRVSSGEVLGWSWMVPPYKKHFDARVVETARVLAFNTNCLKEQCAHDWELSHELLKRTVFVLGQRLQAARHQLMDVYNISR
jgi:CRP-like cAMP-binding protein